MTKHMLPLLLQHQRVSAPMHIPKQQKWSRVKPCRAKLRSISEGLLLLCEIELQLALLGFSSHSVV